MSSKVRGRHAMGSAVADPYKIINFALGVREAFWYLIK